MPLQLLGDEKLSADAAVRVQERLRNVDWFNAHAAEISAQCKGKYVAVVDGRFFAADSRKEAHDLARAHDPTKHPFVLYIPAKMRKMHPILPSWGATSSTILPLSSTVERDGFCLLLSQIVTRY